MRWYITGLQLKILTEKINYRSSVCLSRKGSLTGSSPKCFLMGSRKRKQALARDVVPTYILPWHLSGTTFSFYCFFFADDHPYTLQQILTPLVLFNSSYSIYHASQRKTNKKNYVAILAYQKTQKKMALGLSKAKELTFP